MTTEHTEVKKKENKKVSKPNKSRTLLQYSITYHYYLISSSTSDVNRKKTAVYVANSTRYPYLDVRGTFISTDSTPDRLIFFKIRIHVHNSMRYWIRY